MTQAIRMLRWGAVAKQKGLYGRAGLDEQAVEDKLRRCVHFDLDFDVFITAVVSDQEQVATYHVGGSVPLSFKRDGSYFLFGGEKAPSSVTFTISTSEPGCAITGSSATVAVPAIASGSFFDSGGPAQLALGFSPGFLTEKYTIKCRDSPPEQVTESNFGVYYGISHSDEAPTTTTGVSGVRGWKITGGSTYAQITFDRTRVDGATSFTEKTTLTLRHTPQP